MNKKSEVVSTLNNLLEKNCDSKRGYQKIAEDVDQPTLKGWLMSLAEQRENFKKSIKEEIRFLGGEPIISRQVSGPIQEAFENSEILFILNNVDITLTNCLKYELQILDEYSKILRQQTVLPSTINLVIGQQENVKVALSDLKVMVTDPSLSL